MLIPNNANDTLSVHYLYIFVEMAYCFSLPSAKCSLLRAVLGFLFKKELFLCKHFIVIVSFLTEITLKVIAA